MSRQKKKQVFLIGGLHLDQWVKSVIMAIPNDERSRLNGVLLHTLFHFVGR